MDIETELKAVLIRLAECSIDWETWNHWWEAHGAEVKKIVSPGDFSRLNCAPSLYGYHSYMEKCQIGAERYLTKRQVPFRHAEMYSDEAEKERRQYNVRLNRERAKSQEEENAQMERDRRDPEGLPLYKEFIEFFVNKAKTESLMQKRIVEQAFPENEANQEQIAFLGSLSSEQRQMIASWLQAERADALFGVLARLDWLISCDELELYQHGCKMPYMTFDDMIHDFTRRMQGGGWPDSEAE